MTGLFSSPSSASTVASTSSSSSSKKDGEVSSRLGFGLDGMREVERVLKGEIHAAATNAGRGNDDDEEEEAEVLLILDGLDVLLACCCCSTTTTTASSAVVGEMTRMIHSLREVRLVPLPFFFSYTYIHTYRTN